MIHNITEERKKLNKCDVSLPAPLTEEELMRLIETVEERELLHAPGHLKENICSHIRAGKQKERKRALFAYRAKVLVGMAAALAVLFLVPVDGTEAQERTQTGIRELVRAEEMTLHDAWEQDILDRQRDIDRTWEKYLKGQKRADVRKRYFGHVTEKLKNYTDQED